MKIKDKYYIWAPLDKGSIRLEISKQEHERLIKIRKGVRHDKSTLQ